MLDDIAGLVMVQVISNLGSRHTTSLSAVTIVRPIVVSIGFILVAFFACKFLLAPLTIYLNKIRSGQPDGKLDRLLSWRGTSITLYSGLLLALVISASYVGTSNLFAAYMAGAIISWWDSEVPHLEQTGGEESSRSPSASGLEMYQEFYQPAVKWVLLPFLFASIGFSIPITQMFRGSIIWKGFIYAILMAIGKLFCSLWLMPIPSFITWAKSIIKNNTLETSQATELTTIPMEVTREASQDNQNEASENESDETASNPDMTSSGEATGDLAQMDQAESDKPEATTQNPIELQNSLPNPPNPISLYPAMILGIAMVARGEVGFLISSIAQSNGMFGDNSSGDSEVFLIVTWAIVVCTVVGPFSLGLLVRRVKRLEKGAESSAGKQGETRATNIFGVWGVQKP